jgi:hypothetical protein
MPKESPSHRSNGILLKALPRIRRLEYFYNHAHRLRLEKLLYLELSRSLNRFF